MEEHAFIGKPIPRVDGVAKATGQTRYVDDMTLPGLLHGRVLRSPLPHARIVRIDAAEARALPGVKAVITGLDFPDCPFGSLLEDEHIVAREKVRFVGDRVAAVAAVTAEVAEAALALIRVEYAALPAVFDPLEALAPGAPLIHEGLGAYTCHGPLLREGNVCSLSRVKRGDVAVGFAQADLIFEDRYTTPMVHQAHVETRATMAVVEPSGQLVVWAATPSAFGMRDVIARILDLPAHMVRLVAAPVGGSFGGRNEPRLEPICARLAQVTGRPVKMVVRRAEEFVDGTPRHASIMEVKTGVTRDGAIVAREARLIFDTGAYAEFGPAVASEAARQICGPYRIPHLKVDSMAVYTNKLSAGCFRAHGTPQPTFASESQIDAIAAALGQDPLAFRLKNAMEDGDAASTGEVYSQTMLKGLLRRVAEQTDWGRGESAAAGPVRRGRGVAVGQWRSGGRDTGAVVRMNQNGSVVVMTGAVDVTGSDTILTQIAAEELGLPLADVRLAPVDTDTAPFDRGSSGTRVTFNVGQVVRQAAQQIREQLCAVGAELLEANPQDLELRDRRLVVRGAPDRGVPLAEVAGRLYRDKAGLILGQSSSRGLLLPVDPSTVEGLCFSGPAQFIHAAQVAEVEVNTETGEVRVVGFTSAHDIGRAINPLNVQGQIEGGIAQGIGFALYEEMTVEEGRVQNPAGVSYQVPTADLLPRIASILVEDGAGGGPFGAKGIGESSIIPAAPAVANAVYDAIGVRIKDLPITPDKVLGALADGDRAGTPQ